MRLFVLGLGCAALVSARTSTALAGRAPAMPAHGAAMAKKAAAMAVGAAVSTLQAAWLPLFGAALALAAATLSLEAASMPKKAARVQLASAIAGKKSGSGAGGSDYVATRSSSADAARGSVAPKRGTHGGETGSSLNTTQRQLHPMHPAVIA